MIHIILLHGLGAHGITLTQFENHATGFTVKVHVCSYLTFFNTIENITSKIILYLNQNIPRFDPILIVGHSLGGIIARHLSATTSHNIQTAITLGTPHRGAKLANRIFRVLPFVKSITIVKQLSRDSLHINECPHFPEHVRHVNIIGIKRTDWINPINWVTSILLRSEHSHDGVVEYDSCIGTRNDVVHEINTSHIGMLISDQVKRIISYEIYRIMKGENLL